MDKDEQAQSALEWAVEADAKFAYFMAGVATALTGYLGQDLEPVVTVWSPAAAEACAVFLFLASAICGLKRLEKIPHLHRLQARRLWEVAHRSPAERDEAWAGETEKIAKIMKIEGRVTKSIPRWALARDYLLFAGLLALVISRVWAGYSPDTSTAARESHPGSAPASVEPRDRAPGAGSDAAGATAEGVPPPIE